MYSCAAASISRVVTPLTIIGVRKSSSSEASRPAIRMPAMSSVVFRLTDMTRLQPQQFVDAGLRARLRVHPLDDHRAVETVAAVGGGQAARDDDRACRHAPVADGAGGAI